MDPKAEFSKPRREKLGFVAANVEAPSEAPKLSMDAVFCHFTAFSVSPIFCGNFAKAHA